MKLSLFFFYILLTLASVARGASWFSLRSWISPPIDYLTIESLEVNAERVYDVLAETAIKNNAVSIFVNQLSMHMDEMFLHGSFYYTSRPDYIVRNNLQVLYVESLHFKVYSLLFNDNPKSFPGTEKDQKKLKKALVKRKIFIGRSGPVLVGDVIVKNVSLGPFFLP